MTLLASPVARLRTAVAVALASLALVAAPQLVLAQSKAAPAAKKAVAVTEAEAEKLFAAIVKVNVRATPDARSSATLGAEREGTGIVVGDKGLILTIGYLIVEAENVTVIDSKGRTLAAQVVGYDHATGFGLVRTLAPLDVKPVVFGDSTRVAERDPVMIASVGEDAINFAFVVSKRPFSGSWEYALDQAIFTSPPTANWSGAALLDKEGRLLGIGSLIVRDATLEEPRVPGNMFVPIDLLKPIMADLIKGGRRAGPARPWLGVSTDEVQGRLVVSRVSPDGPADQAGVRVGDIILGVGGEGVRSQPEFYRKVWARGGAGAAIPLKLLQGVDVNEVPVVSIDRVDYFKPRTTY